MQWKYVADLFVELKLFSAIWISSTDPYKTVARTPGKWALHLQGICLQGICLKFTMTEWFVCLFDLGFFCLLYIHIYIYIYIIRRLLKPG